MLLGLLFATGLTDLFSVLIDRQRVGAGVLPPHSVSQPEEKQEEKKKQPSVSRLHLII